MGDPMKLEFRLLLDSVRYPLLPDEIERLRQGCASPLNWQVFLSLVDRHQVGSLVYHNFTSHASGLIPKEVMAQLETRSKRNHQAMMALSVELVRIARIFAAEGISICPLKGILLAHQYFGGIHKRDVGDIDILIPGEKLDQAEQILFAQGYRRTEPAIRLTPRQKLSYQQLKYHYSYIHPDRQIPVELHWHIGSSYEMPAEIGSEMLARSQPVNFLGVSMLALTREDTLAFLVFHGIRHGWTRLKWLADLAALLRQDGPIDWDRVIALISNMGIRQSFAQSLLLAQELLGASFPEPVKLWAASEPDRSGLINFWITALQASRDPYSQTKTRFRLRLALSEFRQLPGLRRKLAYLDLYRVNSYDWLDFPLPDRLFWLYSILRPFFWLYRKVFPSKKKRLAPLTDIVL